MRSPRFIAISVRRPNQRIVVRHFAYSSWSNRHPILKKPVLRGVATLLESLVQGVQALNFSAEVAVEAETQQKLSPWAVALSMATAIALGLGLFVALPHGLTVLLTSGLVSADSPAFHLLDGLIKMGVLLAYVYLIALMQDIHRVFQYHGAEHKSIYAFEAGEELTVENARKHTTLHPRCGTSFLLFLVLISIVAFSIVFPLLGMSRLAQSLGTHPWVAHGLMVALKIVLMLPVAGIAYEFIKACAIRMDRPLFRALIFPGLLLQKLTTREPTDDQLEVALTALRQVIANEKTPSTQAFSEQELEIAGLSDVAFVPAAVAEFPEA